MKDTEICVCKSPEEGDYRKPACVLRSVHCRNRTTPSEQPPKGFETCLESTVGLEGTKARSEQFMVNEDGMLLREKVRIRERWAGFC